MKKIILILPFLTSCWKTDVERLNEMKSPVVVVATGETEWEFQSVLVKDGTGKMYKLQGVVFDNMKVNDTIK